MAKRHYATYVEMTFNSEGKSPVDVIKILRDLGFKPTRGQHDFVYDWGTEEPTIDQIEELLQKLHDRLKGSQVLYQVTTL